MNPKHPLFLTYYNKITAITGSVPPSPREKASAQRPTIFSYGNARHFRLYRIILDPVGANPRVRPTILSCPTVFIKKTAASYPWAHTSVRPYVVKEAWRCFSHIWRIGHACFGQQEDRFACPLPSHCRRRFLATKPHLFLTDYRKIIVITGSVPPSPREKALVREESNIKNSLLPGAPTQLYKSIYPLTMWVVGACTPTDRATPFSSPKSD